MDCFRHPDFDGHEQVTFFADPAANLKAVIAIHDSGPLGIAGGGCRIWPYASEAAALRDALRLSRAMSYKLALAGLRSGGAKCVVIADARCDKTPELLAALGRCVHKLGGRFVIAEDVGTTPADMDSVAQQTPYVEGTSRGAGDTAPGTAHGVFGALRVAVAARLGLSDLHELRVAVQGLGHVGQRLARMLTEHGAKLTVCDLDQSRAQEVASELGATFVAASEVYDVDCDVFCPCALGGVINDDTIPRLRCKVVVGAANNQLEEEHHADQLRSRGILFVPDFIASMGGVLAAAKGHADLARDRLDESTAHIAALLDRILVRAAREQVTPQQTAVAEAKALVAQWRVSREVTQAPSTRMVRSIWRIPLLAGLVLRLRSAWSALKDIFVRLRGPTTQR